MKEFNYADPDFIKNLPNELLNAVETYKKTGLTYYKIYESEELNFRKIIDNVFPSLFIIDYNNIETELKKYVDIQASLKDLLGSAYTDEIKNSSRYSATKLSEAEIKLIISIIKLAAAKAISKAVPSFSDLVAKEINDLLQGNPSKKIPPANTTNTALVRIRQYIGNKPIYLENQSNENRVALLYSDFAALTQSFTRDLNSVFQSEKLEATSIKSIGQVLQYGHTATVYFDKDRNISQVQINTPKVLNIIFDVLNSTTGDAIQAQAATTGFVNEIQKEQDYIEIDKQFGENFAKMFIRIGGNVVRFENSIVNSVRGSVLERRQVTDTKIDSLQALADSIKSANTKVAKDIAKGIIKAKSSNSLLEHIANIIGNTIQGIKTRRVNSTSSAKTERRTTVKKQSITGITSGKKPGKFKKVPVKKHVPIVGDIKDITAGLQLLLDNNLVKTVKQNMGTGNRTDVLNLRSGRFADSVRVERLTQSRDGMITAYYNYMRNPYATFSEGGKQSRPRSRDPKLLISKSIRELAAQAMITRLRAVLV